MDMQLADFEYWNKSYGDYVFAEATGTQMDIFLRSHLSDVTDKTCIEIGSFPGSYLPVIGRKGYTLSGIDFNAGNEKRLPDWLKSLGLKTGKFWSADFTEFLRQNNVKYDLVCSFGFIEHFVNYEEMIHSHLSLVNDHGKIIITTPNFRGWMQYLPRKIFDPENLKKHYLPSMNPFHWKEILEANGFNVVFSGYIGKYYFWVDNSQPRSLIQKKCIKLLNRFIFNLNKIFVRFNVESRHFSAFCAIIAEKR